MKDKDITHTNNADDLELINKKLDAIMDSVQWINATLVKSSHVPDGLKEHINSAAVTLAEIWDRGSQDKK